MLSAFGIANGVVASAYEQEHGHLARLVQFIRYHLWSGSCAITTCPSAMTDGAASLLKKHIKPGPPLVTDDARQQVFQEAYSRLTTRNLTQAWTSGQWMTERSGGSDVRGTETVATLLEAEDDARDADGQPLGPWSVSGFKWFSSATDSSMAILLARTDKGISAFYAPMRRLCAGQSPGTANLQIEPNGITIQRLKNKMGTKPLPTAELVLENTRAYLLGEEGAGTREIATVLNISRIHNVVSSLGFWGRGLGISRAFSRVRKLNDGTLLEKVPAHVRAMARNTVNYTAMMHLGFFAVTAIGITERPDSSEQLEDTTSFVNSPEEAAMMARLITPVAKAMCAKYAIVGLQECMESLGGVGYMEDEQKYNIARLYRDANVLSIWEGTTDVLAADVVRVISGKSGEQVRSTFSSWIRNRISNWGIEWAHAEELIQAENDTLTDWFAGMDKEEMAYKGRDILERIAWIVAAVMMVEDANTDANRVAVEIARRWILRRDAQVEAISGAWKRDFSMDWRIACAPDWSEDSVAAKL